MPRRLDLEDRQSVDAAAAAPTPALQPRSVELRQFDGSVIATVYNAQLKLDAVAAALADLPDSAATLADQERRLLIPIRHYIRAVAHRDAGGGE